MKHIMLIAALLATAATANAERTPYATMVSQQAFGEVVLSAQQSMCPRDTKLMFIRNPGKRATTGCYRIDGDTVSLRWPTRQDVRPAGAPDTLQFTEFSFDSGR